MTYDEKSPDAGQRTTDHDDEYGLPDVPDSPWLTFRRRVKRMQRAAVADGTSMIDTATLTHEEAAGEY